LGIDGSCLRNPSDWCVPGFLGEEEVVLNPGDEDMKRKIQSVKHGVRVAFALLGAVQMAFFLSCAIQREDLASIFSESESKATLVLKIEQSNTPKTLEPDVDLKSTEYDINGQNQYGDSFTENSITSQLQIDFLPFGDWTVRVTGKNSDGLAVATGEETTSLISGEKKNLKVIVKPIKGYGSLDLTVLWTAGDIEYPSIQAQLMLQTGAALELPFQIVADGQAVHNSINTIPTGYHTLILKLCDNGCPVIGGVEVVRIVDKKTTYGTLEFYELNTQNCDLDVSVTPEMDEPLVVLLNGQADSLEQGSSMTVTASVPDASGEISFTWYVNGEYLAAGAQVTLGADLLVGVYRLDVQACTEDRVRWGSTSHTFMVVESMTAQATLMWDPNTEADLAGYKIYYGYSSNNYEYSVDVGDQTTYTLTGLDPDATYYIAATAYNTSGYESDFSNEVIFSAL